MAIVILPQQIGFSTTAFMPVPTGVSFFKGFAHAAWCSMLRTLLWGRSLAPFCMPFECSITVSASSACGQAKKKESLCSILSGTVPHWCYLFFQTWREKFWIFRTCFWGLFSCPFFPVLGTKHGFQVRVKNIFLTPIICVRFFGDRWREFFSWSGLETHQKKQNLNNYFLQFSTSRPWAASVRRGALRMPINLPHHEPQNRTQKSGLNVAAIKGSRQ